MRREGVGIGRWAAALAAVLGVGLAGCAPGAADDGAGAMASDEHAIVGADSASINGKIAAQPGPPAGPESQAVARPAAAAPPPPANADGFACAASTNGARPAVGATRANPRTGRTEQVVANPSRTALIIGDSQAAGGPGTPTLQSWPVQAVRGLGYGTCPMVQGGLGYTTREPSPGNYLSAINSGRWILPHGDIPLVVVVGGGNDVGARTPVPTVQDSARTLVRELRTTYPQARIVVVGVLSRSANDGGGERLAMNRPLSEVAAQEHVGFVDPGGWVTQYSLPLADQVHLQRAGHNKAGPILTERLSALTGSRT